MAINRSALSGLQLNRIEVGKPHSGPIDGEAASISLVARNGRAQLMMKPVIVKGSFECDY